MKNSYLNSMTVGKAAAFLLCGVMSLSTLTVAASPSGTPVAQSAEQGTVKVSGLVLDENGEPIIGATIAEVGTKRGTSTDVNGKFTLSVAGKNATVNVSYIGYKTAAVAVNGQSALRIIMQPATNELDEVVVTALGIKRDKKALGYAMQEVSTAGLTENKSHSVANMLQGKVAGVQIAQSGTGVGGSTRIVMRGLNSLSQKNQPLWVVDGLPISDNTTDQAGQWGGSDYAGAASQINPEDIESISVLKGANAAALYGSRAQNGTIIITTKKGKYGQPLRVEYNGTLNVTTTYSPYEYQNIYGQGSGGQFDINSKTSWGAKMEGQTVEHWRNKFYGDDRYSSYQLLPQNDYISDFYRAGVNYTNTVTASAGSENLSGRFSFTDSRNNDVIPNYSQNRQYFDMNTQFKSKYIDLGVKVNYMREKTLNRPGQGEYGVNLQLVKMARGIRLADLKDPRGVGQYAYNTVNWTGPSENYSNPYAMQINENGSNALRNRIIGQVSATAHFTDYLRLTGRVGIDWYNDILKSYNTLPDPSSVASSYSTSRLNNKEFNADLILYFDKTFNDFSVTANLGTSVNNIQSQSLAGSAGKFAIPGFVSLSNGSAQTVTEGYSKKEIQSVFAQASVGYKGMLYLDLTGRNDWSSTLPANNRSYFYPSVGLSGIITEMVKLPDWLSYWKVRGSWAKVGNDTDPYKLMTYYYLWTGDKVNPDVLKLYRGATKALADLKPESTTSFEIGTEARFFNNRLNFDFTYYNTETKDQILGVALPGSSGYSSKRINGGLIKSHGLEVMLGGTIIQTKDWNWDMNINWGLNRTTCEKLDSEATRFTLNTLRIGSVVVDEGGKYGDIVGKAYKRDDKGNIIVDNNGLPMRESNKVVGNMMPNWTGSITNTLRWKDLTFSALIDVREGGEFISLTDSYACQAGTSARTLEGREGATIVVPGVTADGKPNTKGVTAENYWSSIAGPDGIAEEFVYSSTYVKMREMSLGYILPQKWFMHSPISYVKLSLVARDLFYIYKAAPVNPEGAFSRSDYAQAFELGSLPPTRSIGFSLNVKF